MNCDVIIIYDVTIIQKCRPSIAFTFKTGLFICFWLCLLHTRSGYILLRPSLYIGSGHIHHFVNAFTSRPYFAGPMTTFPVHFNQILVDNESMELSNKTKHNDILNKSYPGLNFKGANTCVI